MTSNGIHHCGKGPEEQREANSLEAQAEGRGQKLAVPDRLFLGTRDAQSQHEALSTALRDRMDADAAPARMSILVSTEIEPTWMPDAEAGTREH